VKLVADTMVECVSNVDVQVTKPREDGTNVVEVAQELRTFDDVEAFTVSVVWL